MAKKNRLIHTLFEALFTGPETIRYPFGDLDLPEGFRGTVDFTSDLCTGCGLCVRDCPANGLVLLRESRETYELRYYPDRCAYCGQCQLTCPHGAISHSNQMAPSTTEPNVYIVVVDRSESDLEN
jgi:formate hydrogenlyase subunit 6/NADH:ubiquinone oxidoreductase subunit I